MVSIDRDKAREWKQGHLDRFGHVELHGGRLGARGSIEAYPWFDHFWPELQGNGGTSVLMAVRIAKSIGFDEVLICGAPLSRGPYLDGDDDWSRRDDHCLDAYRNPWERAVVEECLMKNVYSMSGWTKNLLGEPIE